MGVMIHPKQGNDEMIRTAKCISVEGDDGEFSDLVGTIGKLRIDDKSMDSAANWFDGGNSVNFTRKRVTEVGDQIKVFTKLGNIFKFKVIH